MKILSPDRIKAAELDGRRQYAADYKICGIDGAEVIACREDYIYRALLQAQLEDTIRQVREELIRVLKGMPDADNKMVALVLAVLRSMRQKLKKQIQ